MNVNFSEHTAKLIERIGFPAVVALLLLAIFVSMLLPIKSSLEGHTRGDAVRTYLLRRICLNTAPNADAQADCIQEIQSATALRP